MSERQGTELRHQSVSQSESTPALRSFLQITYNTIKRKEFVFFRRSLRILYGVLLYKALQGQSSPLGFEAFFYAYRYSHFNHLKYKTVFYL